MSSCMLLGFHDFVELHSGKYDEEVRLYAFDNLMRDGDDLRKLPLSLRKPLRALSRLKTALSRPKQGFDTPWERQ